MINTNVAIPIVSVKARIEMANMPTAIPIEPVISSGLRHHLSTVAMATTVNMTLTNPITTVCSIEASVAAPML